MSSHQLVAQFGSAVRDLFPQFAKPTAASIAHINAHFGIIVPPELILLATESASYSSWFAGLGEDYAAPTHIIRINSYWRRRRPTRRIPASLIAFTRGFDDQLWCFKHGGADADLAVRFWSPDEMTTCGAPAAVTAYPSFSAYLAGQLSAWREAELGLWR